MKITNLNLENFSRSVKPKYQAKPSTEHSADILPFIPSGINHHPQDKEIITLYTELTKISLIGTSETDFTGLLQLPLGDAYPSDSMDVGLMGVSPESDEDMPLIETFIP